MTGPAPMMDDTDLVVLLEAAPLMAEVQRLMEQKGEVQAAAEITKLYEDANIQINRDDRDVGDTIDPDSETARMLKNFSHVTDPRANRILSSSYHWLGSAAAKDIAHAPTLKKEVAALLHQLDLPPDYTSSVPPPATPAEQATSESVQTFLYAYELVELAQAVLDLAGDKKAAAKLLDLSRNASIQGAGGPDMLKNHVDQAHLDAYKPVTQKQMQDTMAAVYLALARACRAPRATAPSDWANLMEDMKLSVPVIPAGGGRPLPPEFQGPH